MMGRVKKLSYFLINLHWTEWLQAVAHPCNFTRMVLPWLSLCDCWLPSVSEQQPHCKAGAEPVPLSPWSNQLLLRKSAFPFSEWPCTGANADIRDVSRCWPNFFLWLWYEKYTWFFQRLFMTPSERCWCWERSCNSFNPNLCLYRCYKLERC